MLLALESSFSLMLNGCEKSNNGGVFDPDESFLGDKNGSYVAPYENCTEDLTAALHTVISHTTILLETGNYSINLFILVLRMLLISL